MDLGTYVDNLRAELATAAETAGEQARELAERLTAPLESAVRLTLLEALSAAADEITRDLAPGSVDLRLRGRDAEFVVTPAPAEPAREVQAPAPVAPGSDTDDATMVRINLRMSEQLKSRAEEAAGRDGISVNAWLVRAVAAALDREERGSTTQRATGTVVGQRYTGWVR